MIHRDGYNGPISFECDSCNEEIDTGENDFHEALSQTKAAGWRVAKINGEWSHFCSFECQKQTTRDARQKLPEVHNMSRRDAVVWLGLDETTTKDDARAAYLRLIKVCHPDKGGTDALAQLLNEAYDILK